MASVTRRLPIVGVMGSGSAIDADLERRAAAVGTLVAKLGCHLLTGGGAGVMAAAARAFTSVRDRPGLSIGVLPGRLHGGEGEASAAPAGYPNPWIELPIRTHLPWSGERGAEPLSRNHVNVLSSDALVALDGGAGTASEIALALRYRRPLVAFLAKAGPDHPESPAGMPLAATLAEVEAFLRAIIEPVSHP